MCRFGECKGSQAATSFTQMLSSGLLFQVGASPFLLILLVHYGLSSWPSPAIHKKTHSSYRGKTSSTVASGQLSSVPVAPILEAGEG